jgi:hypothetical protein
MTKEISMTSTEDEQFSTGLFEIPDSHRSLVARAQPKIMPFLQPFDAGMHSLHQKHFRRAPQMSPGSLSKNRFTPKGEPPQGKQERFGNRR